jgi:anti-sigma B factor antagonist
LEITALKDPFGLSLSGEIDMVTAPELHSALWAAMEADRPVTLDMKEVSFIDSSGFRAILTCALRGASNGSVAVVIQNPSPAVARVIEILGIDCVPQIRLSGTADRDG